MHIRVNMHVCPSPSARVSLSLISEMRALTPSRAPEIPRQHVPGPAHGGVHPRDLGPLRSRDRACPALRVVGFILEAWGS